MSVEYYAVHSLAPSCHDESWNRVKPAWAKLGRDMAIERSYSPLTIKALYVTGLIVSYGTSVNILMNSGGLISTVFYPAYALFASAVDLLGRCLVGSASTRGASDMLKAGFMWLTRPSAPEYLSISDGDMVISTRNFEYSVQDLIDVRHFSAHGQATVYRELKEFDYLLLGEMPGKLANAIQSYLSQLISNLTLANCLAASSVIPYRNRPIFDALWSFNMEADRFAESVAHLIRTFDWRYRFGVSGIGSAQQS